MSRPDGRVLVWFSCGAALYGVRLARVSGGERVFLDELPPGEDGPDDDIDCGPVCQVPLFTHHPRKAP